MMHQTPELLIACALKKESSALRGRLGLDCQFLVTGLGARRTSQSLQKQFESHVPSLLIFTGTAGQLDPALELGEVVLPEEWCLEDGACFSMDAEIISALRESGNVKISGRGLTVSTPVVRAKSRRALYQKHGAHICDMESAIALKLANKHAVPCLAPKIVSDTAGSGLSAFWKSFDSNMDVLAGYVENLVRVMQNTD
jgi:nucleoside phosphorylase